MTDTETQGILAVAKAIAQDGFGRSWGDFLPINAHDTDQGDLIEYAAAAYHAAIANARENAERVEELEARNLETAMERDHEFFEKKDALAAMERQIAIVSQQAARIEALEEALTPSGATKCAFIGEFKFSEGMGFDDDGHDVRKEVTVPWTTVKEIMKAISDRAARKENGNV